MALPLVTDVQEFGVWIKICEARIHPDAVIETEIRTENRVDHEVGEAASGNAVPGVSIGTVRGRFVCPTVVRREKRFYHVGLRKRTLISRFGEVFYPSREPPGRSRLVNSLGGH